MTAETFSELASRVIVLIAKQQQMLRSARMKRPRLCTIKEGQLISMNQECRDRRTVKLKAKRVAS